jgi:predicted GNAT family acetyltransferase
VWEPLGVLPLHQMVCAEPLESPKLEVIPLSPADVPEMLQLVEATQPGPFAPRTIELGRYVGVRDRGRLVAMAGERLSLEGYTEVSAVCTDPEFRGQGLGEGLVRVIGSGIQRAGRIPFLHVLEANLGAIGLYQKLGFEGRGTRPLTTLLRR